jgi:hypothetical protein
MQKRTYILLVVITLCFVTIIAAQPRNYEIKNGISIGGGLTQYDIITDNFETSRASGWLISLAVGGELPHKWYDISYNMQLAENNIEISGRMTDDVAGDLTLKYKIFTAQAGINFHINIIGSNLTLDVGPQLQYNSELDLKNEAQESYFINGYDNLNALDIKDINQFNINGVGGLTAGIGPFKVRAQYIYGITNMLDKLNDLEGINGSEDKFKGNQGMITLAAFFTF